MSTGMSLSQACVDGKNALSLLTVGPRQLATNTRPPARLPARPPTSPPSFLFPISQSFLIARCLEPIIFDMSVGTGSLLHALP